jgi:tungstate transport system permease protein
MGSILEGFIKAFSLIVQLDRELLSIILLSLEVSGSALLIASSLGIPAGSILGLKKFRGRGFVISLSNTFM